MYHHLYVLFLFALKFSFDSSLLQLVKIKTENYGLEVKSTFTNKIVSSLSKESDAYKTGLREGKKVISHQVNYLDVNKPIVLKVLSNNNTEETFILERSGKAVSVPQYMLVMEEKI